MVRLQTYALGQTPSEAVNNETGPNGLAAYPAVNVDVLRYVLGDTEYAKYAADSDELARFDACV